MNSSTGVPSWVAVILGMFSHPGTGPAHPQKPQIPRGGGSPGCDCCCTSAP